MYKAIRCIHLYGGHGSIARVWLQYTRALSHVELLRVSRCASV